MIDVPFLLVGLGLGARHAADPDHVAALWNFVTVDRRPQNALWYAVSWGLGHAASFTCVGMLVLVCGVRLSPWFERSCQALVGLMLLLLGARRLASRRISVSQSSGPTVPETSRPPHETFFVGVVHGLAGSAALALLLLATQSSRAAAVGYLLMFGAGSVVGMVALTVMLLLPLSRLASRVDARSRLLSLVPSLLSAGLGALILVDVFRG